LTGMPVPYGQTGSFELLAWQFLWVVGLWMGSAHALLPAAHPRPFTPVAGLGSRPRPAGPADAFPRVGGALRARLRRRAPGLAPRGRPNAVPGRRRLEPAVRQVAARADAPDQLPLPAAPGDALRTGPDPASAALAHPRGLGQRVP